MKRPLKWSRLEMIMGKSRVERNSIVERELGG